MGGTNTTAEGYGSGTEVYGNKAVELIRTVATINLKGVYCRRHRMQEIRNIKCKFHIGFCFVANVKSTAGIGTYYGEVKTVEQSPMADGTLIPCILSGS